MKRFLINVSIIYMSLIVPLTYNPAASLAGDEPRATSGGPDVPITGCFYYEHSDFNGAWEEIPLGVRRRYVGDAWNDQISSIACSPGCALVVWEDRDFGGASERFAGNIMYVGDSWNDDISSMEPVCND